MVSVSGDLQRAADNLSDALDGRSPIDLALATVGVTGGFVFANEVADFVLPRLGFAPDPTTPRELGASAGLKVVLGLGLEYAATRLPGVGLIAVALVGMGVLGSAGLDLWDMLQRGGIPGRAPMPADPQLYAAGESANEAPVGEMVAPAPTPS